MLNNYLKGYISVYLESLDSIPVVVETLKKAKYYVVKEIVCDLTLSEELKSSIPDIVKVLGNLYLGSFAKLESNLIVILPQIFGEESRNKALASAHVVFQSEALGNEQNILLCSQLREEKLLPDPVLITLPTILEFSHQTADIRVNGDTSQVDSGVIGGTFDHLHPGHSLFLTLSALVVGSHLTIGIATDELLQNKSAKEVIQDFELRSNSVKKFLKSLAPGLEVIIVPIQDPVGPAGTDSSYKVLVATEETKNSIELINQERQKNGLEELRVVSLELLEKDSSKISSTLIRERILEKSENTYSLLKPVWLSLTAELNISTDSALEWWELLATQYMRSFRHYHTLPHLWFMVSKLQNSPFEVSNALLLAIYFHDVIYYPSHKGFEDDRNDEMRSKDLFLDFAEKNQLDPSLYAAADYILATIKHEPITDFEEEKVLLDLDMSILASEDYSTYAENIRKEFYFYDKEDYSLRRTQVLKKILSKDRIYFTEHFHQLYEEKARENIKYEIESLSLGYYYDSFYLTICAQRHLNY